MVANASLLRTGIGVFLGMIGMKQLDRGCRPVRRARRYERIRRHVDQHGRHLLASHGCALDGSSHRDAQVGIDLAPSRPVKDLDQSVADQRVRVAPPTRRTSSICEAVRAADSSAMWIALSVSSMNGAIISS